MNGKQGCPTNYVVETAENGLEGDVYSIFRIGHIDPYRMTVAIEGMSVTIEIDKGASVTLMSKATQRQLKTEGRRIPLELPK